MSFPPSSFAESFRAHVLPDLQVAVDHHAWLVEIDEEKFSEAFAAVMRATIARGFSYLSEKHQDMLEDWIGAALLDAAAAHTMHMAPRRAIADRVFQDVLRWEAALSDALG